MSTDLIAGNQNQLHTINQQPFGVRLAAKIISWIFHPIFIPVYVIYFLTFIHPYLYAGFSPWQKLTGVMIAAFMSFTFFPLVTVLLLKGLKFIDTIYLNTQRDRIIPLIACMIWYFWIWYIWKNFGKTANAIDMPAISVKFAFAAFITTIIGLMANIKMKISLHAISVGVMLTLFIIMAFTQELNFGIWLSVAIFITGLVCTARFLVSDHTAAEIYGGLAVGMLSMMIGWWAG